MAPDYDYLTLKDVCRRLKVSRETAYRWLKAGRLKGSRLGRHWRFSVEQLAESLADATPPTTPLRVADLFAGAGGLSLGFHLQGFRSVFFNDIDAEGAFTFQQNFPSARAFVCPIEDLTAKAVFADTGLKEGELDVLLGGPPCQGFSINAPRRSTSDARNHLFRHYVRLVLEGLRPRFVVFENVPGLVSLDSGRTLRDVCAAFRSAGYEPSFRILNACHYGVPQERWRLVIVANRLGIHYEFPSPSNYSLTRPNFRGGSSLTFHYALRHVDKPSLFDQAVGLSHPVTVRDAIGDLPSIQSGGGTDVMKYTKIPMSMFQSWARAEASVLANHHCVDLAPINRRRMRYVRPGGSWRDIPHDLLPAGMKRARRSDHTRRYGRLHPDVAAFTVMTKCDPHWGTVVHYSQERVISVREAARFQSFPDTFRFFGTRGSQYRQVGNAVPPLLAQAVAGQIRHYLELVNDDAGADVKNVRSRATALVGSDRI
jgi:DNA (cytosine-5)-methyltransferase 1